MAHNQINEVDELLKGLKKVPGFKSYLVLNGDGIVIRWDQGDGQMSYQSAVQHGKSRKMIVPLFSVAHIISHITVVCVSQLITLPISTTKVWQAFKSCLKILRSGMWKMFALELNNTR